MLLLCVWLYSEERWAGNFGQRLLSGFKNGIWTARNVVFNLWTRIEREDGVGERERSGVLQSWMGNNWTDRRK